jgi:hypothetical protein
VRPYSLDDAWQCLSYRYEQAGRRVPRLWIVVYRLFRRLLLWWAR